MVETLKFWSERFDPVMQGLAPKSRDIQQKALQQLRNDGKINGHKARTLPDGGFENWEKQAIFDSHDGHPTEGYRRLPFMTLDVDIAAVR